MASPEIAKLAAAVEVVAKPNIKEKTAFSFDSFEKLAKGLAVVIALLYGLGLLVTNQYLMSLGVTDFSSLKPKYVLTGAWTFVLICIAALPAAFMIIRFRSLNIRFSFIRLDSWTSLIRSIVGGLIVGLIFRHAVYRLLSVDWHPIWGDSKFYGPMALLTISATLSFIIFHYLGKNFETPKYVDGIFWSITVLVSMLVLANFMGLFIYNQVPEAWGGGKPISVALILNDGGIRFWKQTRAIAPDANSMRTPEIDVLYQNDHEMLISAPYYLPDPLPDGGYRVEKKRIMLNKSLVDGILPQEEKSSR